MSQKTNPISLRLQNSNKHFESCWYSDFFYDQVLGDEIKLRTYMENIIYQAGRSKTLPSIQCHYKRYCTFLFFLDQRGERHKREFSLKVSREPTEDVLPPTIKNLPGNNKVSITTRDHSLLNQAQDVLCRGALSRENKNSFLIEEGATQKRSSLSHNAIQEYIYNYAIKGSYNELNNTLQIRTQLSKVKRSDFAPQSSGAVNFLIKPKGFLTFSITSFALVRGMPYRQYMPIRQPALVGSTLRSFDKVGAQFFSEFDNANKTRNPVPFNTGLIKEPTSQVFSVQKRGRENIFRRLIIGRYSESTQNRLSYSFVKNLDKQLTNSPFFSNSLRDQTLQSKVAYCSKSQSDLSLQSKVAKVSTSNSKSNKVSILDNIHFNRLDISRFVNLLEKTDLNKKTTCFVREQWQSLPNELVRYTELLLNLYHGNFKYHTIYPIRAISPYQSAGFLIDSVVYLLQRKSSFRQIKDELFRELDQNQLIKGARLSCAGRLGGRSKKAQKAKTQTAQWGETSLTLFSSRLSFASKGVKTTYGKVGVKLWLCYKS